MKRKTAIRNANEIARKLLNNGGIIGTPDGRRDAYVIRRMWLFGSTVKGKANPNDVDILIDAREVGRIYKSGQRPRDKEDHRRFGTCIVKSTRTLALQWLRGNRKMIRFHQLDIDGDLAHPRVMIYPRNELEGMQ